MNLIIIDKKQLKAVLFYSALRNVCYFLIAALFLFINNKYLGSNAFTSAIIAFTYLYVFVSTEIGNKTFKEDAIYDKKSAIEAINKYFDDV